MMGKLDSILLQGMDFTLDRQFALELHNIPCSIKCCFIRVLPMSLCPMLGI